MATAPPIPPTRVYLPCPECKMRQLAGSRSIGNNRSLCRTCNTWVSAVRRLAINELMRKYPVQFAQARRKAETDLYPQVYEDWLLDHPYAIPEQETMPT